MTNVELLNTLLTIAGFTLSVIALCISFKSDKHLKTACRAHLPAVL